MKRLDAAYSQAFLCAMHVAASQDAHPKRPRIFGIAQVRILVDEYPPARHGLSTRSL